MIKKGKRLVGLALFFTVVSQWSYAGVITMTKFEKAGRYYLVVRASADGEVQADFFGGIIRKPATTPKPTLAGASLRQLDAQTWILEAGSEKDLMEQFALLRKEGQF